jgi:tRNA-splicing ligase RtcB
MYEGAAVLFPLPGAHKSACSVNHGSGRLLARDEAKRRLEHNQQRIDDEMVTVKRTFAGVPIEGIARNHKHVPLDECAHVYKDLDEVLALEAEGIASVAHRLYPVANIKGTGLTGDAGRRWSASFPPPSAFRARPSSDTRPS